MVAEERTGVVGPGNARRVAEVEAILAPVMAGTRFVAVGELDLPDWEDPEEDGDTFLANALIKARAAAEATGLPAVADDSGLVVDALGGEPGIFSARWAGVHGDDAANNAKLEASMADVPDGARTARFHSAVALVEPDGSWLAGEGDCEGSIGRAQVGENGFGYDPLFLPDETPGRTMAQLTADEKNRISHRFHALEALAAALAHGRD